MSKERNIRVRGERRVFEVSRFMAALQALADQRAAEQDQGRNKPPGDEAVVPTTGSLSAQDPTTDDQEAA